MSLSLRDELCVVLYRDQLQLLRIGRELTLAGIQLRVVDKKTYTCEPEEKAFRETTLKALEFALAELPNKPAFARVILSSHYMNYAMVELSKTLNGEAEEHAYAKHYFSQLYGAIADTWDFRLNDDYSGTRQLVSALDKSYLQELRAIFLRANIKLKSIQPYLMAAYNNCTAILQNQDAWFVLYEPGVLCMGFIRQGHWCSVRTFSVGDNWYENLHEILDREALLSEVDVYSDNIFLWAPAHIKVELPKSSQWKMQKLQPLIRDSFTADYSDQFAIAMCG